MRRFVTGLCMLMLVAGLLVTTGCEQFNVQRDDSLRIVGINRNEPIMSDLVDFGEITISEPGEEPEIYPIFEIPTDVVEIELQYVEIGLGLPTWTPYWASIERANISYQHVFHVDSDPIPIYDPIQVGMSASVEASPEGRRTERVKLTIAPGWWKEQTFVEYLQRATEDDDYGPVAQVRATVRVDGTDYVSGNRVQATKSCDIIFGNFWDDPSRLGQ